MTLLDAELEERAAFHLLASSGIRTYKRAAIGAAEEAKSAWSGEAPENEILVRRIRQLWKDVLRSDRRHSSEVELAVLLAAARNYASDEFDNLLRAIALSTHPAASWLSALAREIVRDRSQDVAGEFVSRWGRIKFLAFPGDQEAESLDPESTQYSDTALSRANVERLAV